VDAPPIPYQHQYYIAKYHYKTGRRGHRNPLLCAFFGYFLGTQESNVKKKKADAFFKGAKTVRSFAPEPTQKGLFEKSPS